MTNTLNQRKQKRRVLRGERLLRRLVWVGGILVGLLVFWLWQTNPPLIDSQIVPEASLRREWIGYPDLELKTRVSSLEKQMQFATGLSRLRSGFLFFEPATGEYTALRPGDAFSAASIIKLPVLVELFRQVDQGQVRLDEKLILQAIDKGGGSGWIQYRKNGTQFSLLYVATLMIVRSDNTATNMIIRRLGGAETLNRQFQRWGLEKTVLRQPLPDLKGQNTSSPQDLALLLVELERGHLLTTTSHQQAYEILRRTRIRSLLPSGLGPGVQIFHKTGDIGKMVGDAGIILLPNGKRYIAVAMVERPRNDRRANQLISKLSQLYYHYQNLPLTQK